MRLVDSNSKEVFSVFPYLEISKKIKLYEKMMKIMVDKTFALFSNQDIEFSINLSYEDIANEAFMKFLYEKINSYKNPKNIIFEILESDFIEDFSVVKEFTTYVRTKGC